jgi:hypothetical protein
MMHVKFLSFIGLLTEYLNSGEDYDKMHLVIGVGSGVAYLHCESFFSASGYILIYSLAQDVVHSDIRAVCSS